MHLGTVKKVTRPSSGQKHKSFIVNIEEDHLYG